MTEYIPFELSIEMFMRCIISVLVLYSLSQLAPQLEWKLTLIGFISIYWVMIPVLRLFKKKDKSLVEKEVQEE